MKKDIISEAINDAKRIKKLAVEDAQKTLVESLTPSIRKLVNKSLYEADESELEEGEPEKEDEIVVELKPEEEETEVEEKPVDSPEETEEEPDLEELEELEELGEGACPKKGSDEEEDEMDKITLTKEELKHYVTKALSETLGPTVLKNKGEVTAFGEEEFDPEKESDIPTFKSGDIMDKPPFAGKNVVNVIESRRRERSLKENRFARKLRLSERANVVLRRKLGGLKEHNQKLAYALEAFTDPKITKEQRQLIVSALDRFSTVTEAHKYISAKSKRVKHSLTESVHKQLTEGRTRPLVESSKSEDAEFVKAKARLQELAGVKKQIKG